MSMTRKQNLSNGEREYRTIRATINDPELIEWVGEATYNSDVSEQDLVIEGLRLVWEKS